MLWNDVYRGTLDYIHTDAGTNFNSEQFNCSTEELGLIVPVITREAYNGIRKIEPSHTYRRTVYEKLCVDRYGISREEWLSLTI